jgi:hypothetical protein
MPAFSCDLVVKWKMSFPAVSHVVHICVFTRVAETAYTEEHVSERCAGCFLQAGGWQSGRRGVKLKQPAAAQPLITCHDYQLVKIALYRACDVYNHDAVLHKDTHVVKQLDGLQLPTSKSAVRHLL